MELTTLLNTMLSMFSTMAVGFLGVKLGMVDEDFSKKLTALLLGLLQPCMILASVLGGEHPISNLQVLQLLLVAVGGYAVLIPLSALLVRLLRVPEADRGTYRFMLVFSNIGFFCYPLVQSLFGANAIVYITIFVLVFQLVAFSYGIHMLTPGSGRFRINWAILRRPLVLVSVAALAIYMLKVQAPAQVHDILAYIGNLTTPLSMMIVGCSLAMVPLRQVVGNWRLYGIVAVKMIAVPLLAYPLLRLFLDPLQLCIVTIVYSVPVATNSCMLALVYGGNQKLASAGVFVSTILSLITIPAILWLLFLR